MIETQAPLLINDSTAWERRSSTATRTCLTSASRRCRSCSSRSSPADESTGGISLQNIDRTNAFTECDVRLLTTLAGSLSVALENARLVHETRQRNAELALINSVQAAIAGELDPQSIYDLVGDKLQEVFDAQVVDIAVYDEDERAAQLPVRDRARRASRTRTDAR